MNWTDWTINEFICHYSIMAKKKFWFYLNTWKNGLVLFDKYSLSNSSNRSRSSSKLQTEDEMAGWHHWLDGRESEWTPGVGDGLWFMGSQTVGHDWATELNWTELIGNVFSYNTIWGPLPIINNASKLLNSLYDGHCYYFLYLTYKETELLARVTTASDSNPVIPIWTT